MSDEQQTFDIVREIFTERVAFNKILGVEIEAMSFENATVRFDNRPELIGNFVRKASTAASCPRRSISPEGSSRI